MSTTQEDLIASARAGDYDALTILLEKHGPLVERDIDIDARWRSMLSAEDVMQVTYLEAFLRIGSFTFLGDGSFRRWLRRIAENNLRDAIKELRRAKRPPAHRRVQHAVNGDSYVSLLEAVGATTTTPSSAVVAAEARELLDRAVEALPRDYRSVVRKFDLEGQSAKEVARAIDRSPAAVYMLRARAHERLRDSLGTSSSYFSSWTPRGDSSA